MPQLESQIKIRESNYVGGNFMDSAYLAAAYDAGKPHEFQGLLGKIFTSSDRFNNKPILGMTMGRDKTTMIKNEIYRWKMQGETRKVLRVVENLEVGNLTPGIGGTTFRVKLDENFYLVSEVVFPHTNQYPCRIEAGPIADGDGYIYELKLQDDNLSAFVPPQYLEVGSEYSRQWNSVRSELNDEFGGMDFGGHFELESQTSAFSISHSITDRAMRNGKVLEIPILMRNNKTGKNETVSSYMNAAEAKMHDQFHMNMEAQLMYGKRSTTKSKNGYFTKTGPGLRQQMQDGHIQYYNGVLTERFLQDYLMDIFFARVNEGDRNITCMTGTGGAILFHDLLAASASSFLQIDTNFVQKVPSNSQDVNHLAYGAQFTKYIGPEGICVTLIKNPMYDDKFYCPEMSPFKANMPIDSFRFTFLDFGKNKDMENNIEFVSVEDTYRWGYVSGTVTPTGPVKGGSATSLTAGITYFMEGSAGVWMKDVSRCGELILDVA